MVQGRLEAQGRGAETIRRPVVPHWQAACLRLGLQMPWCLGLTARARRKLVKSRAPGRRQQMLKCTSKGKKANHPCALKTHWERYIEEQPSQTPQEHTTLALNKKVVGKAQTAQIGRAPKLAKAQLRLWLYTVLRTSGLRPEVSLA